MGDQGKIQFILCVNDKRELEESKFYISRLLVPERMRTELTVIEGASSMAAGYNCGMAQSDAKYRIYLHQDTCLIYPEMLNVMLDIFQQNASVGMLGVVGARRIPENGMAHSAWDTGRIDTNCKPLELNYQSDVMKQGFTVVEAIDGLFMATQYDLPWREDLFKKWDFYDVSQSLEMKRHGYQVAVPYQPTPWCWHDNETSKYMHYEGERRIFSQEYQDIRPFILGNVYSYHDIGAQILDELGDEVFRLVDCGEMEVAGQLLKQYHTLLGSKAELICLENICYVRQIENHLGCRPPFYGDGMTSQELLQNFREDKFLVKRIEYGDRNAVRQLLAKHHQGMISQVAVFGIAVCYAKNRDKVMERWNGKKG